MKHETIKIHHAGTGTEKYYVCSLKDERIGEIFRLEDGDYIYMPMPMPMPCGFGAYSEQTMREIADQLFEFNRSLHDEPDLWSQKYTNYVFYNGMLKSYQSSPVVAQYMSDQDVFLCAEHGKKKREDFLWIGDEIKSRVIGT